MSENPDHHDIRDWLAAEGERAPAPDPAVAATALAEGRRRTARRRRWTVLAAAGGVAAALAVGIGVGASSDGGNGPAPAASEPAASDPTSPGTAVADPLVGCGGTASWPISVMPDGVPGLLGEEEAHATFRALLDSDFGQEARLSVFRDGVDVDWRVLAGDEQALTLGIGPWTSRGPGPDAWVLGLSRQGGSWVFESLADCQHLVTVPAEGDDWVRLLSYVASPDGRTLTLNGTETACTSARDPEPFLRVPTVVETDEAVEVRWTIAEFAGEATCPGNPTAETTVALAEPLGERTVLDGSAFPATPVSGGVGHPLTGTVAFVGGPAPGDPRPLERGTVYVYDVEREASTSAPIGPDGTFTVVVPPGRYLVSATSPEYLTGQGTCEAEHEVVVQDATGGATLPTSVEVFCQVK